MPKHLASHLQEISENSRRLQRLTPLPPLPILAPCHDSFVIGFDGLKNSRRTLLSNARALLCPTHCSMVTVCGASSGAPGVLDRSVNLHTVATYSFDGDEVAVL